MISRSEITFAIHNVVWKLNSISLLELFSSPDKVLCHLVLHYCLFEFGSLSDLKLSGPWYSSRRLSLALVADSLNQWIMPCREKVLSLLWVIQWQCLKWYSMISDVSHWSLDWFLSQSRTVHSVTNQISLKCYLLWSPSELTICLVLSHHDFRLFGSISTLSPSAMFEPEPEGFFTGSQVTAGDSSQVHTYTYNYDEFKVYELVNAACCFAFEKSLLYSKRQLTCSFSEHFGRWWKYTTVLKLVRHQL